MAAEGTEFYLLDICLKYICLRFCMRIFDELQFFSKVMKESNMRFPEPIPCSLFRFENQGQVATYFSLHIQV